MEEVRAANREIGRRYDAHRYDPAIGFALDPDFLFVRTASDGCAPRAPGVIDVLDLGCGTGGQLTRAGFVADGRLVGVDVAAAACAVARARLDEVGFGARAQVEARDFLDVAPGELGTFDLIYLIGTYYITPPLVRAHLAALMDAALAPAGLVVASYYTGVAGRARAAEVAAVRDGRAPSPPDDPVMAFELLSPWLDAFSDDELAAALGLRFLGHVAPAAPDGGYVRGMFARSSGA